MKKTTFLIIVFAVLVSSCNFSGHLTSRYKSMETKEDDGFINKNIAVSAYILEGEKKEPVKPKTIFDLSPKGQAALITEIGNNEPLSEKITSNLTAKLSSKTDNTPTIIDYTQFEKRIVVSIKNNTHFPADRISKINVTLDLDDPFKIISCNKLTTEFQTLDLGKLNYSATNSAELTGNASTEAGIGSAEDNSDEGSTTSNTTSGKTGLGITGKVSASRTFAEEVLLKQRLVTLNATVNEDKLSLYQEGNGGIDLTGNMIADVTVNVDDQLAVKKVFSFTELSSGGAPNDAANVKANESLIIYPNLTNDVKATISFEADYRHVEKRDKTITESDDKAALYFGKAVNPQAEILIPKKKLQPKLWKLVYTGDSTGMPIQINSPYSGNGDFLFSSYDDAKEFIYWLKVKFPGSTGEIKIGKINHSISVDTRKTVQDITISAYTF